VKVLIVGGGVGGLGLAAALRGRAEVVVVERAAAWKPVGAGLMLHANAIAALRVAGVAVDYGAAIDEMVITDRRGTPLGPLRLADFAPDLRDARLVHRADLHAALLAASTADVRLGTSIKALDGTRARLSDGSEAQWDVVVGADGIRSTVRHLVMGGADPAPAYLGYTCWRWVGRDPGVGRVMEMWGRGQRVGLCPLGDGRLYGFLVANAPAGSCGDETAAQLRARFAAFEGPAAAALATLDDAVLRHDDLYDLPDVCWGRGPVVLIGDAAHAQTPNLGQGAATALEDAVILARALTDGAPVEAALEAFRRSRARRVRELQQLGRRIGAVAQWESPVATTLRDWLAWATPARTNAAMLERIVRAGVTDVAGRVSPGDRPALR
jgi:2-polyprenyl-6-methoxyphenol hydroxylase-like FAD-dependent oxidoreductase